MKHKRITRREALKCMGSALAGLALASSGMPALTSCTVEKKRRIVFYFTGTGNGLYVANGIYPEVEIIPADGKAITEAYQKVVEGDVEFRYVIVTMFANIDSG